MWEIICCGEKLVFYCYDLRSVCRLLEKIVLVSEVHLINNGSGGFWIIMKYVLQCVCAHTHVHVFDRNNTSGCLGCVWDAMHISCG